MRKPERQKPSNWNAENELHKCIQNLAGDYVRVLQRLIQTPSFTGQEAECQHIVKERLKELGVFEREVFAANVAPFHPTGRDYSERPNVVGKIAGTGRGGRFILNAHIDTAPVENLSSWRHDPFSGIMEGERIYGRGALDDKAGVAMLLMLAEAFVRTGIALPGDLVFESVIEDEDSGNGTLACTKAGYLCEAAIVIDGTWPFRVIDAHLGQLWLEFELEGVPVAACSHKRGVNPIEESYAVLQSLKRFVEGRNRSLGEWLTIENPFFVNVGSMHGGTWGGAVPESCKTLVQMGFPPPYTPERVLEEVEEMIRHEHKGRSVSVAVKELSTPPFSHRGNRMVRIVKDTVHRLRPGDMTVVNLAVSGHCDLRHFQSSDGKPTDACLYGPGGGGNPHVRDEYYTLEHFVPVAENIASSILGWYGS